MLKNEQQDFVKVDCRIDSKDWSDSQSSDQKRCVFNHSRYAMHNPGSRPFLYRHFDRPN
jgi:hypothetical protein